MIIDEIKKANMQALKEKDSSTRNALSIVINKYTILNIEKKSKGSETSDADVIAILQKTLKELTEEAENYHKVTNESAEKDVLRQKMAIEKFIPKMMSKEEITEVLNGLEDTSIASIMRYFKQNYAGKVNMQDVQEVLKDYKKSN